MTVSRLLEDEKQRDALRGKVLIVDEAGMISGRQMDELLKLAETENVRLLFSGDTRQIQSVEASDALRILQSAVLCLPGLKTETWATGRSSCRIGEANTFLSDVYQSIIPEAWVQTQSDCPENMSKMHA